MTPKPERLEMCFNLRAIFIIFVFLAVGCALLFSTPDYIALPSLVFLTVALPATLTAGVVYSRGTWRAFCIGGLFPSGLALYTTGWMLGLSMLEGPGRNIVNFDKWSEFCNELTPQYRVYAGSSWAMVALIGIVVVLVRHFAHEST